MRTDAYIKQLWPANDLTSFACWLKPLGMCVACGAALGSLVADTQGKHGVLWLSLGTCALAGVPMQPYKQHRLEGD